MRISFCEYEKKPYEFHTAFRCLQVSEPRLIDNVYSRECADRTLCLLSGRWLYDISKRKKV